MVSRIRVWLAMPLAMALLLVGPVAIGVGRARPPARPAAAASNGRGVDFNRSMPTGKASADGAVPSPYVVDGGIDAAIRVGSHLFLGGSFAEIGPRTGPGVAVDSQSGAFDETMPRFSGPYDAVTAVVGDGQGGWYVALSGTSFLPSGASPRIFRLVHILPSHALDPSFDYTADDSISALLVVSGRLFVAGSFSHIGGQARSRVAAFDVATGEIAPWALAIDAPPGDSQATVDALTSVGNTVFVGGLFNAVDGATRHNVAAITADTGALLPWDPGADGSHDFRPPVLALAAEGSTVYVGGTFTTLSRTPRAGAGAVDAVTAAPTGWNPGSLSSGTRPPQAAATPVGAIAPAGDTIFLAGDFQGTRGRIGGAKRNYVAAVDRTTGHATPWNTQVTASDPSDTPSVVALGVSGNTLNVAGHFSSIGGAKRGNIAALDVTSAKVLPWNPKADRDVTAIATAGSSVYLGGFFNSVNVEHREGLAEIDLKTGAPTPWSPRLVPTDPQSGPYGSIFAMTAAPNGTLYVGGDFRRVNGKQRRNLAAFDAASGALKPWRPAGPTFLTVLAWHANDVYVGGQFTRLAGGARRDLARVSATSGRLSPWRPDPAGSTDPTLGDHVDALAFATGHVYVGGTFKRIGGAKRPGLAEVDLNTGKATAWAPRPNHEVHALAIGGRTLYVGGEFTKLGGKSRHYIGALALPGSRATPWNPKAVDGIKKGEYRGVTGLLVTPNVVYANGTFRAIGGAVRDGLAALSRTSGRATLDLTLEPDSVFGYVREPDGTIIAGRALTR